MFGNFFDIRLTFRPPQCLILSDDSQFALARDSGKALCRPSLCMGIVPAHHQGEKWCVEPSKVLEMQIRHQQCIHISMFFFLNFEA